MNKFFEILDPVFQICPDLTFNGLNSHAEIAKFNHSASLKEREQIFIEWRKLLLNSEDEFWACVDWFKEARQRSRSRYYSYGLKEKIENEKGLNLSVGSLIAAAIFCRLNIQRDPDTPNVFLEVGRA